MTDIDLPMTTEIITNSIGLLHYLENTSKDVGLHVDVSKSEFIDFNQQFSIQTVSGKSIKAVESFTYLGSEINPTENVKNHIDKPWTALNKIDVISKSDLPDKRKGKLFQATVEGVLIYGTTVWIFI